MLTCIGISVRIISVSDAILALIRTMRRKVYQQSTADARKDDAFCHFVARWLDAVADAGGLTYLSSYALWRTARCWRLMYTASYAIWLTTVVPLCHTICSLLIMPYGHMNHPEIRICVTSLNSINMRSRASRLKNSSI